MGQRLQTGDQSHLPGHWADARDFAIIDLTPEPNKLLPQTVHGKRITYLSATIPRTSSKNWVLPIEYDFRFPEKLLGLDSDELGARFREHRVGLKEFNIRYVIFPINRNAKLQIELATRLGGASRTCRGFSFVNSLKEVARLSASWSQQRPWISLQAQSSSGSMLFLQNVRLVSHRIP